MRNDFRNRAFTLLELLVVMGLIAFMAGASTLAFRSMHGPAGTGRVAAELSRTLELARSYAMSHNTYVRVAIAGVPSTSGGVLPATVLVAFASADGSRNAAMSSGAGWRRIVRPLVLENLLVDDTLGPAWVTAGTMFPSQTDIAPVSCVLPSLGTVVFDSFVQFDPAGGAAVLAGEPSRFIQIGLDRVGAERGRDPMVLRMSGVNGAVTTLRKEDDI